MNSTFKSVITNPIVIGGGLAGLGIVTASIIHACTRAKTPEELALEKEKEDNREAKERRQFELKVEEAKASVAKHELDLKAEAERQEKYRQEKARQEAEQYQREKELREWEKSAPAGYWELKIAEANGKRQREAADREADTQLNIARINAEATKAAAEAQAEAAKNRDHYAYLTQSSKNTTNASMMQSFMDGVSNVARGTNG